MKSQVYPYIVYLGSQKLEDTRNGNKYADPIRMVWVRYVARMKEKKISVKR
jgi:hypothetical protein